MIVLKVKIIFLNDKLRIYSNVINFKANQYKKFFFVNKLNC